MNIFVLDKSPVKAAQMLCDAHVVKMIVESAQLLSTHDRLTGRFDDPSGLYKPTHVNHPCRKCLDNTFNRAWLICHLDALLSEYYHRYKKMHKTASVYHRYYCCSFAVESMTHSFAHGEYASSCTFPRCMPDEFKVEGDDIEAVIESYRSYYRSKRNTMKRGFTYKNREEPDWL